MDVVNLGRSGLKVSRLCLGTMMFGGPTDETASTRIIHRAIDAGVNFLDTADVYNDGESERITGRSPRTTERIVPGTRRFQFKSPPP